MTAGLIRLVTGAQARWVGVEPIGPDGTAPQRIYFANHSSHLDAPVVWAALPRELRRRSSAGREAQMTGASRWLEWLAK